MSHDGTSLVSQVAQLGYLRASDHSVYTTEEDTHNTSSLPTPILLTVGDW